MTRQTGLMPPWPKGRGIREGFGYLSLLIIGGTLVSILRPLIWPDEYDWPSLLPVLVPILMGMALGLVWLFLKFEKLDLAKSAAWLNVLIGIGFCVFVIQKVFSQTANLGFLSAIIVGLLYFLGSLYAAHEIRAELERRDNEL